MPATIRTNPQSKAPQFGAMISFAEHSFRREELNERGTKPVIPDRCNRKQPLGSNKLHLKRLREVEGLQAHRHPL